MIMKIRKLELGMEIFKWGSGNENDNQRSKSGNENQRKCKWE